LAVPIRSAAAVGGETSAIGTGPSRLVLSTCFQSPFAQRRATVVVPQPSRIGTGPSAPPTDPATLVIQMATVAAPLP
jgi:hypothetical protein